MGEILMLIPLAAMAVQPVLTGRTGMTAEPMEIVSPGGDYYVVFAYGTANTEYVTIERFAVWSKNGDMVYEKTGTHHTLLDIADNGIVVGIDFDGPRSGQARLVFYDGTGSVKGTALVGFLLERMFSDNGVVYCVHDGMKGVRVFSNAGNALYELGGGNSIAVSPDGSRIAVAGDNGISVFLDGEMTDELPVPSPFVRQMKFSRDNDLFGYITKRTFNVYDLQRSARLLGYDEAAADRQFISFDIMPLDAGFVCGLDLDKGRGTPDRHTQGFVYYFDAGGTLQWQDDIAYEKWNIHVPSVDVDNEHGFTVTTAEQVYHYEY